MGLCLRLSLIGLCGVVSGMGPSEKAPLDFRQADVCELLKYSHEELQNEYPNEYYDCHAHSRFIKMSLELRPAIDKKG